MGLFGGTGRRGRGHAYEAGGRQIVCGHCGNTTFTRREAQLNTQMMSLFDLDGLNASALALVCTECGHLEWFVEPGCVELTE
ncbi:MAG: DNA-binding protein [Coriobacteriaceae bacterium]|nr:DNA-binding protein [Coriobacteriaceae bacterium]